MSATYTFDAFCSLDGFGATSGNWTGYWGKQGPELLDHRLSLYEEEQRMVLGANTYRAFAEMLATSTEDSEVRDPWVTRMRDLPATVVSSRGCGRFRPGTGRTANARRSHPGARLPPHPPLIHDRRWNGTLWGEIRLRPARAPSYDYPDG